MGDDLVLPDVYLTPELCASATIEHMRYATQCCRFRVGTDSQSDYGETVRCSNPAALKIRLATGQFYDLCEDHAMALGVLTVCIGREKS